MERLQKYLSRAGVASRRHAETLITDGRVKVNNKVVTELGSRVDPVKDLVLVDGKHVAPNPERKYFLFYKPPGVVTTLSDPEGRPTVGDYAQDAGSRVFPVGRLDYDAEGALLLTDDGELANKLMHPSHQVPRVYLAKVKGVPDEASLQKLVDGVRLEDGMANATQARIFEKAERNTWVKIVVTEGRQHLVYNTLQHHEAPSCTSDLLYKGALQGKSRLVWRGMIKVDKAAQKTDGYQRNDNLMLSREARADSIPGLEIEADDVRCTHGATSGRVDNEQIFYAQARGLSADEAARLVVAGFFQQVFDRITIVPVREALARAIGSRIRRVS